MASPPPAGANAAAPFQRGSSLAEPGGLAEVVIEREELALDLRPLAEGRAVLVEAIYRLKNERLVEDLDLVFVSGGREASGFTLTLDGKSVPSTRLPREVAGKGLPVNWKPPATTPGIGGGNLDTSRSSLPRMPRHPA